MNFVSKGSHPVAYLCLEAPREGQASFVHTHEIITGLKRLGWSVDLYAPNCAQGRLRRLLVVRMLEQFWVQLRLLAAVRRYDSIYIRAHPVAWLTACICRLLGRPVIQEVNGPLADMYIAHPAAVPLRRILNRAMMRQYRWASGLIAVTPGLANWLKEEVGVTGAVAVIPNAADTKQFSPTAQTAVDLPETFVVFVGALPVWHDVHVILRATRHADWPGSLSLVLVGTCCELEAAQTAAAKDARIRLLGRVPYQDVAGIIAKSRAALITISDPQSRAATGVCPIKLFEAMACGVPTIVTDLPYQAQLVREIEAGIVFPSGDEAALAAALKTIIADPQRASRMANNALRAARNSHCWQLRAKETADFLAEVISGTKPVEVARSAI